MNDEIRSTLPDGAEEPCAVPPEAAANTADGNSCSEQTIKQPQPISGVSEAAVSQPDDTASAGQAPYPNNGPMWQHPQGFSPNGYPTQQSHPGTIPVYYPGQSGSWQDSFVPPSSSQSNPPKKKHKVRNLILILLLIAAIIAGAVFGINTLVNLISGSSQSAGKLTSEYQSDSEFSVKPEPKPGQTPLFTASGAMTPAAVYEKGAPSIVGVLTYNGPSAFDLVSEGSGVILSEDGLILTNAHLTTQATRAEVVLSGGEVYQAQIIGSDISSDVAVLYIDADVSLVPAEFGDPDDLVVGEQVCAIGNPGGLTFRSTLTVGYVSALDREILSETGYTITCIQNDAAISPGSSGGGLFNEFGQVVGLTTAKIIYEGYEGLSFALPIDDVLNTATGLIENGSVSGKPILGITAIAVTAEEAAYYSVPLGIWVVNVTPGTDAYAKGLRSDDIIREVDGIPVYSVDDIHRILNGHKPGDSVTLSLFRRESSALDDLYFDLQIILSKS